MRRIIILNSKGGCGKTTIATNLASLYSLRGIRVTLYDYDPQSSSVCWLEERPSHAPKIHGIAAYQSARSGLTRSFQLRMPADTQRVVIDTPASLDKPDLLEHLRRADTILVPVTPSAIDVRAAMLFLNDLLAAVRMHRARIGIIANRLREQAAGLETLEEFLQSVDLPIVARFRDSADYLVSAERGLGIHELAKERPCCDLPEWERLYDWIENSSLNAATTRADVANA